MQELQLPTRHDWSASENAYGKIAIDSFEPGFALTVGIAYRRALLSAIHGAAPTWVKIENVLHEFSHLPGVQEDTLDIMMNLRKVVFALHVRSEEHTSELQSLAYLVCRLLLEKKKSALARYSAICRSL